MSPVGRVGAVLLGAAAGVGLPRGGEVVGWALGVGLGGAAVASADRVVGGFRSPASTQPPVAPMIASSTAARPPPMISVRSGPASPRPGRPSMVPSFIPPTALSPATVSADAKHCPSPFTVWYGAHDSPHRAQDVTLPGMARVGWGASIATAAGVAAGAGAAQLGFGYGLGILNWAPAETTASTAAWVASLIWATWIAATSTIFGAVCAQRLHDRRSVAAGPEQGVAAAGEGSPPARSRAPMPAGGTGAACGGAPCPAPPRWAH